MYFPTKCIVSTFNKWFEINHFIFHLPSINYVRITADQSHDRFCFISGVISMLAGHQKSRPIVVILPAVLEDVQMHIIYCLRVNMASCFPPVLYYINPWISTYLSSWLNCGVIPYTYTNLDMFALGSWFCLWLPGINANAFSFNEPVPRRVNVYTYRCWIANPDVYHYDCNGYCLSIKVDP